MMFLLNTEPKYDHVSNSNSWVFFNNTNRLIQFPQCDGTVRYALSLNFGKLEVVFSSKGKFLTPTEKEDLETVVLKRLWYSLNEVAEKANELFELCNEVVLQKGK